MAGDYNVYDDIWPNRFNGEAIAPVGNGINSRTLGIISGWPCVEQNLARGFATRYHTRVMRYYVGCFVPHLIGKNTVPTTITRFWWAIATFCELWEPRYAVQRINMKRRTGTDYNPTSGQGVLTSADDIRKGNVSFQLHGLYMPRGHLGDRTPAGKKSVVVIGDDGIWRTNTIEG